MDAVRSRTTAAAWAAFVVLGIGAARGAGAQGAAPGAFTPVASACYSSVYNGVASLPQAPRGTDAATAARSAAAERDIAVGELRRGASFAAVVRLERLLARGSDAAALATLALAYDKLGCRAAFVAAAEAALAAGPPPADASALRFRLAVARGAASDSSDASAFGDVRGRDDRAVTATQAAWGHFAANAFDSAAAAFGRAAEATPATVDRMDVRLLEAQALLQAGRSANAVAVFQSVLDSARALRTTVDARVAAGATTAFARAAGARRGLGLAWAHDAVDGRLAASASGESAMTFIQPSAVAQSLAALGAPAADPVVRALVWMPAGAELAALRAVLDTLGEADARVARAAARIERLRAERPARMADAARYVATVRAMNDSLAAAARQLAGFADSVARRDSAISRTISEYRTAILAKITDVSALAARNRRSIDSIGPSARAAGELTTRFLEAEQGTAGEYLAVAGAAQTALDRALSRLDIEEQRDTVHAKRDRLVATLSAARTAYDSSLAAALAAESGAAAAMDQLIGAANAESAAALEWQTAVAERAAAVAAAALASRAPALNARLDAVLHAAGAGLGTAQFFVAVENDTLRAPVAEVTRKRDAALASLADALASNATSVLRPTLLLQSGELLTRKADAEFAAAQRAGASGAAAERPDYGPAIARFDEIIRNHSDDPRADVAAYTMGTLAYAAQRYDDAARAFALVKGRENSRYRAEAYFRDGDGRFEQAVKLSGAARRSAFASAAEAYAQAITLAPAAGDIYFLSLYKLGWSDYMQAEQQNSDEYRQAVDVFGRLVREVDALPPERQARLALRQEAIDYLAIAITQLGGADEAVRYLGAIPDIGTRMLVLRRVAHALRDQGEFSSAVIVFRGALAQAPTHPNALDTRIELVDLFQSRMLEPVRAQQARLELADSVAPSSPWGMANPSRAADAAVARERVLREAGGYALSQARRERVSTASRGTARGGAQDPSAPVVAVSAEAQALSATAAAIFARYLAEFSSADSAQRVSALEADARFAARDWFASGAAYSRTATRWTSDSALVAAARRNAVVAFDSALASERRVAASAAGAAAPPMTALEAAEARVRLRSREDSLFAATERFAALAPDADARAALVAMGRRASEAQRWDVVADVFTRVADRWPADAGAPDARKFVGDARYKLGRYDEAQGEWRRAHAMAVTAGRKAFADSITSVRVAAASQAADSLTKRGEYVQAADSILTGIANDISDPARAADVLRNAIEVHIAADSTLRAGGDTARARAARNRVIGSIETLATRFPAYQHTLTYSALRARLLSDAGRPADAVATLTSLVEANPTWPGRADAMVRVAVLLDSLGKPGEAAAAYERFSAAYPADRRAADAQYNAAVILRDSADPAGAARAFLAFTTRFPRDPRVGDASAARVAALRVSGDTASVAAELARLCVRPPAGLAPTCADRAGATAFREGMARWDAYAALRLEIKTRAQLTRVGVDQASLPKLQALRAMTQAFTRAVASAAPQWVAAGTFQTGLAQWHYGLFLRDVILPADLTEAQRTGAEQGSAQQAQQYFDAAIKAWTALVEKAGTDGFNNEWVEKARAALRGEGIPPREKPAP